LTKPTGSIKFNLMKSGNDCRVLNIPAHLANMTSILRYAKALLQ